MAVWNVMNFRSKKELIDYLNGALKGTVNLHGGALVDGLTFDIDLGAGVLTTTFAPALGRAWTPAEIVAAIEAADPTLVGVPKVSIVDGEGGVTGMPPDRRLALFLDGSLTVKSTGTANLLLGFSDVADTIRAGVADTDVHSITRVAPEQDSWVLVTYA
jgi:hypothetical protein